MGQRRWLELMKDCDLKISYHLGNSNVVADALSQKSTTNYVYSLTLKEQLVRDFEKLKIAIIPRVKDGLMAAIVVQTSLIDEIKAS